MTLRQPERTPRGDLIDGRFVLPAGTGQVIDCVSPADLDDRVGRWPTSVAHMNDAMAVARGALRAWRKRPVHERAAHLREYARALTEHKDRLAVAISRAIGKPTWEARTEVEAMIAKIEITLGAGLELVKDREFPDLSARVRYRPVGVCAVVGPFNFPGHLANGHIVPALATGNVVVFKPSERAPEVGEIMAECFLAAGFPAGVIQVVQGAADVARALIGHPDVDGVMFTGSTQTGRVILAQSAQWPGRMLALEMGGKNSAIVLDDADLDHAAREIAFAAYVTAGQRCTATSRVLVDARVADRLIAKLEVAARETRIGAPDEPDVFLGPVISQSAMDHALAIGRRLTNAFEALVPARVAGVVGLRGYYLRPSLYVARRAADLDPALDADEWFAPLLTVEITDNDDAAVARANATPYGLAGCVFTQNAARFRHIADDLEVGICNWNRGTVGSSSKLPFGGVRGSGNHRPAGLFSSYYCVDPVGELLVAAPSPAALAPGLRVG